MRRDGGALVLGERREWGKGRREGGKAGQGELIGMYVCMDACIHIPIYE